jgi:hypothetical protein
MKDGIKFKTINHFSLQVGVQGFDVGKLKMGDYLLVRVKKGVEYIDPKEILRCKVIKVDN